MEWISVKDRLPKNSNDVLIVYNAWGETAAHRIAWLEFGKWETDNDGAGLHQENVLYWMPLPEPPKQL